MAKRLGIAMSRIGIVVALVGALLFFNMAAVSLSQSDDEEVENRAQQQQDQDNLAAQCQFYNDYDMCVMWGEIQDEIDAGVESEEG